MRGHAEGSSKHGRTSPNAPPVPWGPENVNNQVPGHCARAELDPEAAVTAVGARVSGTPFPAPPSLPSRLSRLEVF